MIDVYYASAIFAQKLRSIENAGVKCEFSCFLLINFCSKIVTVMN